MELRVAGARIVVTETRCHDAVHAYAANAVLAGTRRKHVLFHEGQCGVDCLQVCFFDGFAHARIPQRPHHADGFRGAERGVETCHAIAAGAQSSCDVSGEFFTVEGCAHLLAHEFTAPNGEPDLLLFRARGCPSFSRNETLNTVIDLRAELSICLRVRAHFLANEQCFLIHDTAFSIADLLRIGAFSFTEQVTHLVLGDLACELEMSASAAHPLPCRRTRTQVVVSDLLPPGQAFIGAGNFAGVVLISHAAADPMNAHHEYHCTALRPPFRSKMPDV